ncbi:hypothetical protein VKT23_015435 [Stygiomarasmius scandens]|uniref:Uncharacterized protein n=1 Tax=Marasmiellus scandens TaxID=2682957 RepID=A0ABR1IXL4_9AGAR
MGLPRVHVWGSNSKPEVNNAWSSDVKADYDGIPSGGEFDANIRDGAQFIDYLGLKQHINSIYGGDGTLAKPLVTAPAYPTFEKWRDTSDQNTSLLSFVVVKIWSLMKGSLNEEISAFGPRIQQAFEWIVDHPKVYKTAVSLVIESDWAEFGLLTPSAVIITSVF